MELDAVAAEAGVRLIALDETGSTNAHALNEARQGERGPFWVVARTQSAGRGRRGREWVSKPGTLSATLLLSDPAPARCLPQLSFVTALAVHDAMCEAAPALGPRLTLKWPNDVLCGGAKICGILLEGEGSTVAAGIGVNCAHHPANLEYPATDLATAGALVTPDGLFTALSRAMVPRIAQWQRGEGLASILADWLKRADGLNRTVRVRLHDRELSGVFVALDDLGRLVLRRSDGTTETIAAGDVFPLNATGVDTA